MAGRVGRRINDKFYFVVDEVGGSSDCESELTSDNDVKPIAILPDGNNMMKPHDTLEKKLTAVMSENENKIPNVNTLNCSNYDGNISEGIYASDKSNEGKQMVDASGGSINGKEKSLKDKCTAPEEESFAVVDMDIDPDVDSTEPQMKPLLKVIFRDEIVQKRFKSSFFKFMSQKFEDCTLINSENGLEIEVYDMDSRKSRENDLLDFNLDTTPGDSHLEIPNYGKSHDLVLSDKSLDIKQNDGKLCSTSCFNCLGNHNLRDCPKVKDFREINKNRLKFQNQKEKLPKTSRYHLDEHQKFSHLVPGVISKKLRAALNLRRDQQPGFIYRMRLLGYPPAWLEEAKISHSGVAMYDDTGVPVLEDDEEEGEILPEGAKDKFDITKIIEFPGFNVPLPNSFKDESKFYHCPALSEEQSKENLIKLLQPKMVQAYVKKSLNNQKCDEKSLLQNELKRVASPTIEEMEEKKRQLLMALNSEDASFDAKATPEAPAASHVPTTDGESDESRKVGTVKNLEFGTPILKSVSPFSKLPSREQFSCNVSDVINFENLPNTTGKYETMKEVISKIRISVSKSQKE